MCLTAGKACATWVEAFGLVSMVHQRQGLRSEGDAYKPGLGQQLVCKLAACLSGLDWRGVFQHLIVILICHKAAGKAICVAAT